MEVEKRLVDANAIYDKLLEMAKQPRYQHDGEDYYVGIADAQATIVEAPTEGSTKGSIGKWIGYESDESFGPYGSKQWYICSECGKDAHGRCYDDEWYSAPILSKYCPNCGTKMNNT